MNNTTVVPEGTKINYLVTAPIPATSIREYFVNKNIQFIIDYKESTLKGKLLLTYLTNLNMPVDVSFVPSALKYTDYAELMEAYLNQRAIVNCQSLVGMAVELLLYFAGVPGSESPYVSNVSDEWMEKFCRSHTELLATWRVFLDSMVIFIGLKVMKLNLQDNEQIPIIDDRDAIGHNVANVIGAPNFLMTYIANTALESQAYFKKQFEEPIFAGKHLIHYFYTNGNDLPSILRQDAFNLAQTEEAFTFMQFMEQQPNKGD